VICCTLVANTGYLGYPLVAALLGFDRLSEAVIYDVLV
jgi:predicted permease